MSVDISTFILPLVAGTLIAQVFFVFYFSSSLKKAAQERAQLYRDLFGVAKKIEGLTAQRREMMVKHYDKMLETLAHRLPGSVAAQTSQVIFEAESKILSRLAELEPDLKSETSMKKMDDLIQSMEALEQTIVTLTADAVQKVMLEGRRSLLEQHDIQDASLAA